MRLHSAKKWGTIVVVVFTVTLFVLGVLFSFRGSGNVPQSGKSLLYFSEHLLPLTYTVSDTYRTHSVVSNSSWGAAVASLLEGSYRYFGVQTNFLPQKQYVRFSINSIINCVTKYCKNNKKCGKYGKTLNAALFPQIVTDNPEFIHELALPINFCKNDNCSNSEIAAGRNTVSFHMMGVKWAQTLADMKHLIFQEEKPLIMSMKKPYASCKVPCSHHLVSNSEKCLEGANEGDYVFPAELPNGEYFIPKDPCKLVLGDVETFLVYGYNDEHVSFSGQRGMDFVKKSTGGFIIKRACDDTGNYNSYLSGTLQKTVNNRDCQLNNPEMWKGADIDCVNETGSLKMCNATLLKCIDPTVCNVNATYAIADYKNRHIVNEDYKAFPFYYLYEALDNNTQIIKMENISILSLNKAFRSNNLHISKKCSYWFVPYELIGKAILKSRSTGEIVHALSIAFTWGKESFAKGTDDSTNIIESTYTYW